MNAMPLPTHAAPAAVSGKSLSPLPAASFAKPPPSAERPRIFTPCAGFSPVLSTSAAALPSGNASPWSTISARRSGTEKNTPRMPPRPAIASTHMYRKSCQWPSITSAGIVKITPEAIDEPAEAPVCTMLFSRMPPPPSTRSTAIETTAAGIADAMVMPAKRPR